jgi:hypothetical protein
MGWLHAYNEHGPRALIYQRTGGRPLCPDIAAALGDQVRAAQRQAATRRRSRGKATLGGRPARLRDLQCQNSRRPARCQRISVPGDDDRSPAQGRAQSVQDNEDQLVGATEWDPLRRRPAQHDKPLEQEQNLGSAGGPRSERRAEKRSRNPGTSSIPDNLPDPRVCGGPDGIFSRHSGRAARQVSLR